MSDFNATASSFFPDLPTGTPAAAAAAQPVAQQTPAAPVAQPTAQASTKSAAAALFPDLPTGTPEAKPAADADAKPVVEGAPPEWLDVAHVDGQATLEVVRDLGIELDRAQATKLVDLHTRLTSAALDRQTQAWEAESANLHPSIISDARAAVAQFGGDKLKAVLNSSGLGSNRQVIEAFAKALRSNPYRNV